MLRYLKIFIRIELGLIAGFYLMLSGSSLAVSNDSHQCYRQDNIDALAKNSEIEGSSLIQKLLNLLSKIFFSKPLRFEKTGCKIVIFTISNSTEKEAKKSNGKSLELLENYVSKDLEIPGFAYEFQNACHGNGFQSLGSPEYTDSTQKGLIVNENDVLSPIQRQERCDTSVASLETIVQYISDSLSSSASMNKIFLFIQIPWTNLTENDLTRLEALRISFDEIPNKEGIGGIYLFDDSSVHHGKFSGIFHSIRDRVKSSESIEDITQKARQDIEKF